MRLALFVGGCTYDAAAAVCTADADTLQSLIDKSLVRRREVAGEARYWMLETIREFAAAELEASGDADALRRTHAEFFAAFAERADPHLRHGPDQHLWIDRLAADYDNVRAAMSFALEHDLTLALRLVGRVSYLVYLRGGFAEAQAWLDASLPRAVGQPQELLGRAHECASIIAERVGDVEGQARHSDAAYAAFAAVGDEHGLADALRERGKAASARGDTAQQVAILTELAALAERIGDSWNGAIALNNLGYTASQSGDWERAVELCGRSAALRRDLGDEWGMALALHNAAFAEARLGRLADAATSMRVALETSIRTDARMMVWGSLDIAVEIAAALGRMPEAARLVGASSRMQEELGTVRDSFEGGAFERTVAAVRAALGGETDAEIQRGRELTLDEAAALALAATRDLD
jgi:tetratricopeptide (TPR) repeat protein